ncbi:MAG TPA: sigma-70 family RNA polymerase sigma factor, partial [Flavisolibacter sp.]|nr:sigma-70 family RNA polymerase sigma factor [Flavisolibacter sp.]
INHLFRHEYGKIVSVLSRLLGLQNLSAAEDIVQDTLMQAMITWGYSGIPENPSAWMYMVAKNKSIDYLRRKSKFREITKTYSALLIPGYVFTPVIDSMFSESEIKDSQLRMIFACCHPDIPSESQIALALKTLCGLSVSEIAKAFITSEETISKRIYRAKQKIIAEKIELEIPANDKLLLRIDTVLQSLYLLFNEGYNSSHPLDLIREELCEEAMRLTYLLTQHTVTNLSKTNALLSLFCFQASRLKARSDDEDNIILLKKQDRNKWFVPLINKGFDYLDACMQKLEVSSYHLEASIASIHARAASFEETDWKLIYQLYKILYNLNPSPVIDLNRAIASAYAINKEFALEKLLAISGLDQYYLYYITAGELYYELGEKKQAKEWFKKAITLTSSRQVKKLLLRKMDDCSGDLI